MAHPHAVRVHVAMLGTRVNNVLRAACTFRNRAVSVIARRQNHAGGSIVPQVAVCPPVEAQPAKKLKTLHGNETSDTDLRLDDGTVARLRKVNDKHGKLAYMSLKLPQAAGQDPVAVVAAFERAIELIAPGCFKRGRCAAAKLA
jgi:hypothetical protein